MSFKEDFDALVAQIKEKLKALSGRFEDGDDCFEQEFKDYIISFFDPEKEDVSQFIENCVFLFENDAEEMKIEKKGSYTDLLTKELAIRSVNIASYSPFELGVIDYCDELIIELNSLEQEITNSLKTSARTNNTRKYYRDLYKQEELLRTKLLLMKAEETALILGQDSEKLWEGLGL